MLNKKKILIFGGTGSLGYALTDRYIQNNDMYIYSRDECKHWNMKINYKHHPHLHFIIGDITHQKKVETTLLRVKPDIIIIAAAMKHVDQCEINQEQCINTNLLGVKTIVDLIELHVNSLDNLTSTVFISTDKACSPINTYGMCKAISEQLMIEKAFYIKSKRFLNVRYGNVLNSNGSIIPFLHKIGKNSDYTHFPLTDVKMTRFVMTLSQSVDLIEYSILHGESGDTIIPELVSMNIKDLMEIFSELYNKPIENKGIRHGEKMLESLINETQSGRLERKGKYYHIKSIFDNTIKLKNISSESLLDYNSLLNPLSKDDLKQYLQSNNLI